MVNTGFIGGGVTSPAEAPVRRLVLAYAPAEARAGLAALLALDDQLADVLRATRDPMIGQMRFTWWHDAIAALGHGPVPAQPVLRALATDAAGVHPTEMVEGWEALLDPDPLDDDALRRFADGRGTGLFRAAGRLLGAGAGDPLESAGRSWALDDLAANTRDSALAARAQAMAAREDWRGRWSRGGRPLGALAHLARGQGSGAGVLLRALFLRLTGI